MKFPIFKAFFASIAYVLAHFVTVVKILWLPTFLLMAVQAYLMPSIMDAQMQMIEMEESGDPSAVFSAMGPMFGGIAILYGAMAILYPMMTAGMLRHVVRGEEPRLPFYFSFGFDELRVLAAFVLLFIMMVLLATVGALAVTVLGVALAALSPGLGGLVSGVMAFVLFFGIIWFMVRMSVVFAAAIGERSVGIAESWRLTQSNFWPLLIYWIFWFVVMLAVMIVYFGITTAGYMGLLMEMFTLSGDPDAMAEVERRMLEMQRDMWDPSKPGFWPFAIASYVFMILYTGIWTVAGGVAYRYLSGTERGA